jgi:hypothetical protein
MASPNTHEREHSTPRKTTRLSLVDAHTAQMRQHAYADAQRIQKRFSSRTHNAGEMKRMQRPVRIPSRVAGSVRSLPMVTQTRQSCTQRAYSTSTTRLHRRNKRHVHGAFHRSPDWVAGGKQRVHRQSREQTKVVVKWGAALGRP